MRPTLFFRKAIPVLFAALLFAGCGKESVARDPDTPGGGEPGPEFTTRPLIGPVAFTPAVPGDREAVTVRARLTCPYGFRFVHIVFQLDGEEETTIVAERRFPDGAATSVDYEGVIPGQRSGAVVKFHLFTRSRYGVGMASPVMQYVVSKAQTAD